MAAPHPTERLRAQVVTQEHELGVSREILKNLETLQETTLALFSDQLPRQQFPVDIAQDGVTRVIRGFTMDGDSYSGHFDEEVWTGAALIDEGELGILVVEEHYPSSSQKGTHFSRMDLNTGELSYHREDETSRGDKPLPGADVLEGEEKAKILRRLVSVLKRFSDNYTTPHAKNGVGRDPYVFETDVLQ